MLSAVRLGEYNISSPEDCKNGESKVLKDKNHEFELKTFSGLDGKTHCNQPLDFKVVKISIHQRYDQNSKGQYNDIALLKLEKPVEFNEFIQPICLPIDEELNNRYNQDTMVVAGWGRTGSLSFHYFQS